MTRKQRVITAINHKITDYIPSNIYFTQQEYDKMSNYYNDSNFIEKINNHIARVSCDNIINELPDRKGFFKDIFGVVWNRNGADKDIGVIDSLVLTEPCLDGFKLPEVNEKYLREQYNNLLENKEQFLVGTIGFSLFERAWTLCGMENVLIYMVCEKDFLHSLLDMICERNLKVIDIAMQYDIDGFYFGDDWGQQKGLIMGPAYWREFIKPRLKRMYERVKNNGKYVIQHSCGDIEEVFPDLIDIGLDVYQTFQPEIYEITKVKKQYGNYLTFWGGISTQHVLAFGKPEDVKKETIETMKIMGVNGGYIVAPTHDVPGDVPAENVDMLINIINNQEKYL